MTKNELKQYLKRTDIVIEGNIAKWNINCEGQVLGKYVGEFQFKTFLTPLEKLACGRLYRELLGPNAMSALTHEESLAFNLSQLKFRVLVAPPFWEKNSANETISGDIPDAEVLEKILDASLSSEFKYLALLQEKKEKAVAKAKKAAEAVVKDIQGTEEDNEKTP